MPGYIWTRQNGYKAKGGRELRVLLVNGSPHQKGCTYTALSEVASALNEEGIDTDFYWISNKPIGGCIGCFQCAKKQKCVFDDIVQKYLYSAQDASEGKL